MLGAVVSDKAILDLSARQTAVTRLNVESENNVCMMSFPFPFTFESGILIARLCDNAGCAVESLGHIRGLKIIPVHLKKA